MSLIQNHFLLRSCCQSKSVCRGEDNHISTQSPWAATADDGKRDWLPVPLQLKSRLKLVLAAPCFWVAANTDYGRDAAVFQCDQPLFPHGCSRHNVDVLPVMWWNNLISHAEECPDFQTHPLLCFANFSNKWSPVTRLLIRSQKWCEMSREKNHITRDISKLTWFCCCSSFPYTSQIRLDCIEKACGVLHYLMTCFMCQIAVSHTHFFKMENMT